MRVAIITGVDEEAEAFLPGQYERVEQHGHLSVRFVTHMLARSARKGGLRTLAGGRS